MAVTEAHPSLEELTAFTRGTLADEAIAGVEAHVAACQSCQERAAGDCGDSLVELLRRAHVRMARPSETVTEAGTQAQTPVPLGVTEALKLGPAAADGPQAVDALPRELAEHDRYHIVRLLGVGGMGCVFEAEHRVMRRPVAVKVISRAYTANPAAVERFRREVQAAARLAHPNIVTAHDAEQAGDTHFLVMELVDGKSLARVLKERGPLPVREACEYVRQAALGLQHAHEKGMVHRDVKPDNLMLTPDGTVKVLDFGLAALTAGGGSGGLTEANVIMGTPDYMAPEQAEDSHKADIRADVYSLGCTLYHLLTGSVPYPADTSLRKVLAHRDRPVPSVRAVRPEVPRELERVLARLLAKKPEDRYQTPGEAAAALAPFAQPSAVPPKKRSRMVVVLAALVLAGIAVAGAVVYRIQTDKGELVIATESDDVEVVVKRGGKVVRIIDTKTEKSITLASGTYDLELKGAPEGLKLNIDKATLTRGETVLAKIERVRKAEPAAEAPAVDGGPPKWSVADLPDKPGVMSRLPLLTTTGALGCFSQDGRLYAMSEDHNPTDLRYTRIYETATGRLVRRFDIAGECPTGYVFMPGGKLLLVSAPPHGKRLWSLHLYDIEKNEYRTLNHIQPFDSWPGDLQVSGDGKRLLARQESPGIELYEFHVLDLETGRNLLRIKATPREEGLAWERSYLSEDGKWLLNVANWLDKSTNTYKKGRLRVIDVEGKRPTRTIDVEGSVNDPFFARAEGKISATRSQRGKVDWIETWDLATGTSTGRDPYGEKLQSGGWPLNQGRRIVVQTADKRLVVFEMPGGKEVYGSEPIPSRRNVVPSHDGRTIAVLDGTTFLLYRLPDPPPAKEKPTTPEKIELIRRIPVSAAGDWLYHTDISKDGKYALVTRDNGNGVDLDVYDVATGDRLFDCPGFHANFLGDGEEIVVFYDWFFSVRQTRTGKLLRKAKARTDHEIQLDVAPDGKHLLCRKGDYGCALFDLAQMKEQYSWPALVNPYCTWSADGKRLCMHQDTNRPWLVWDVDTNRASNDFAWVTREWEDLLFQGDGKTVLARRGEERVLAETVTGKVIKTLTVSTSELVNGRITGATGSWGRPFHLGWYNDGTIKLQPLSASPESFRYQLPETDRTRPPGPPGRVHLALSSDNRYAAVVTRKSLFILRLPPLPDAWYIDKP